VLFWQMRREASGGRSWDEMLVSKSRVDYSVSTHTYCPKGPFIL
jgi:hypothetical protein